MPSSTLDRGSLEWGPRLAALVIGMLAGPVVWAALLETNYVLSYVACEHRAAWILYIPAVVALALIGLAALAVWRAAPARGDEDAPSVDPARTAVVRARFMELFALALCAFFALAIVATEIPVLVLHPCSW
jgi:hypothetical protein